MCGRGELYYVVSTSPSDKIRLSLRSARALCHSLAVPFIIELSMLETSGPYSTIHIRIKDSLSRFPYPTCRHSQTFLLHQYIPYYPHACDDAGDYRKVALEPRCRTLIPQLLADRKHSHSQRRSLWGHPSRMELRLLYQLRR